MFHRTPPPSWRTVFALFLSLALAGAPVAFAAGFQRLVVAGGSITEIVYALGAGHHLVAVDSTSTYPAETSSLPDIGYLRQLSAEPILSVRPTLLLVDRDAGPPVTLDQLRAAGVEVITVPEARSPSEVTRKIRFVAEVLDAEARGAALVSDIETALDALEVTLSRIESEPSVLFLLSVGRGAPLAAGNDTSAQAIIELAGGRNAMAGFEGFKPASSEVIAGSGAEFILVSERTVEMLGGVERLLDRPEIAATPAGREGNVVVMDGLLLLGFGARVDRAAIELAHRIHGISGPRL
jgi:iron complex transport system substrate-binding protein